MAEYYPRLNKNGMLNNPYWYSTMNKFWSNLPFHDPNYWGLPNCTCYAFGRWLEISGGTETIYLPGGDAGTWFPTVQQIGYYETGNVAQLGAVICWSQPGRPGHVAVVEEILDDGSIITSNSGYYRATESGSEFEAHYFWTERQPPDYSKFGYVFQGFIYNPYSPHPIPSGTNKMLLYNKIRRRKHDIGKSIFTGSLRNRKYL